MIPRSRRDLYSFGHVCGNGLYLHEQSLVGPNENGRKAPPSNVPGGRCRSEVWVRERERVVRTGRRAKKSSSGTVHTAALLGLFFSPEPQKRPDPERSRLDSFERDLEPIVCVKRS